MSHRFFWRTAYFLSCYAFTSVMPVHAEESDKKTESKSESSNSQVEIRVENQDRQSDSQSEKAKDNPAKTRKTNEKRKDSSNRVQLEFHQVSPNHQPFMMGGGSGMSGANAMHFSFPDGMNSSMVLGPEQKKDLRRAILESLEQNGLSSDVIAMADKSIEKALDEFGMPRMGIRSSFNTTFRIGVKCQPNRPGENANGLEVINVHEQTPASKAGIKPGDRLVSIDDKPIRSHEDIVAAVQEAGDDDRAVHIKAIRGDVEIDYEIEPERTAVADLDMGMGASAFGFQPQAWVMPQRPNGEMSMEFGPPQFSPRTAPALENQNEKNIDKLHSELSDVRKELDEMKDMLKKMNKQP
ncbi:MAG: PDZ domain-containing protein [Pirellulaceae bacterium]|nr:PDZ domain-containing protein [Pirellulaceae bacterium]